MSKPFHKELTEVSSKLDEILFLLKTPTKGKTAAKKETK